MRSLRGAAGWLSKGDPVTAAAMAILCVYYFFTWGAYQGKAAGDGWFGFLYLRAIVFYQTIDMRTVAPEFLPYFGLMGPGGHMPNRCPIGPVFLWLPFYLIAVGVMTLGRLLHIPGASAPVARVEIVLTGIGTLLIVLLGWRALFSLVERHLGRNAARLSGIVAVFATPLLWYTANHPFYQHGPAFGVLCLFVDSWDRTRGRDDLKRFVVLGLLGGFGAMMRLQEILFLLLPAAEIAPRLVRGPHRLRWLLGGLVCVAAAVLAFSPQLAAWHYYTGNALKPPQIEPIRWREPFLATALFSTRAGLFPWTPIAYAAGLGALLALAGRRRDPQSEGEGEADPWRLRGLVAGLLLVFALNLYVVSCAFVLHGGFTFGARRLSDAALLIGLGVAVLFARSGRRGRIALLGFAAFCVVFNGTLSELLRQRKIRGSSAEARSLASWLEYDLHAPGWAVRLADNVGYPFVQPAGWLFAAWHHVKPAAYESVVGNSMLEREGQWMQVLANKLPLDRGHRWYAASGLRWPTPAAAEVTGPVRLLVPMFARESAEVVALGRLAPGPLAVRCNGIPARDVQPRANGVGFTLPTESVRAGVNVLELDLPTGTTMEALQFTSREVWWR